MDSLDLLARFLMLMAHFEKLTKGDGFTIYIDLDSLPGHNVEAEVNAAEIRGRKQVLARLDPIGLAFDKLRDMLHAQGQLFLHETRGLAYKTDIPWTEKEISLLKKIQEDLENLDQFIEVP